MMTYKGKIVKYDTRGRAYISTKKGARFVPKGKAGTARTLQGPVYDRRYAGSDGCSAGKRRKTIKTKRGPVSFCAAK